MGAEPYLLALSSHRGGTGRTTSTAALAWALGQREVLTAIYDTDPIPAVAFLANDENGRCSWKNVRVMAKWDPGDAEIILVDSPPLTHEVGRQVLTSAHGVLLHGLADPLSLRTMSAATMAFQKAREKQPDLELLGILLTMVQPEDELQVELASSLVRQLGGLLLDPFIPYQSEFAQWPLQPGAAPPAGQACAAYEQLADQLIAALRIPCRT